jgi:hypothetical protein
MSSNDGKLHKKLIEVTVQFDGGEKKTFSGLHIQAHISELGGGNQSFATIKIYGMAQSDMNRLTVTGSINPDNRQRHKVTVAAGEADGLMQVVHTGSIDVAFINAQVQPSRLFEIQSRTALAEQMMAVKASSFKGSVQVSTILAELAKDANLTLVDKGIGTMPLDNAYFTGDPISKIHACVRAAGIAHDINNGRLTVWLSGQEKNGGVVISAKGDNVPLMIGVPSCSQYELTVATQFFTGFNLSEQVKVESDYNAPATGLWLPRSISYDLECLNPRGGGNWRTILECGRGSGNA